MKKKVVYDSSYLATSKRCFGFRIFIVRLLDLNITDSLARQNIPEFLTANHYSIYVVITLILRKLRTENLKFRTDLRDQVMDDRSATQKMIILNRQIAQKILKSKIEATRHSSFTELAANFGCFRFRIRPEIVSKLLRPAI